MTQRRSRGAVTGGAGLLIAVAIGLAAARGSGTDATESNAVARPGATGTSTPDESAGPGAEGTASPAAEPSAPPTASGPYCGASRYVEEITVQRWSSGEFRVSVWPTDDARRADDRDAATDEIWQAVQRCVSGLEGEVAASLRDQLRCHEYLALVPGADGEEYATGDTFDVESWRPTPGRRKWFSTRCGNSLGTDPTTPPVETYRPDGVKPQRTVSGEHA